MHVEAGIKLYELNAFLDRRAAPCRRWAARAASRWPGCCRPAPTAWTSIAARSPTWSARSTSSDRAASSTGSSRAHGITTQRRSLQQVLDLPDENIHYDDDWFNSVLVSVGSLGIIYSLIVEVVPQYDLVATTGGPRLEHDEGPAEGQRGSRDPFAATGACRSWSTPTRAGTARVPAISDPHAQAAISRPPRTADRTPTGSRSASLLWARWAQSQGETTTDPDSQLIASDEPKATGAGPPRAWDTPSWRGKQTRRVFAPWTVGSRHSTRPTTQVPGLRGLPRWRCPGAPPTQSLARSGTSVTSRCDSRGARAPICRRNPFRLVRARSSLPGSGACRIERRCVAGDADPARAPRSQGTGVRRDPALGHERRAERDRRRARLSAPGHVAPGPLGAHQGRHDHARSTATSRAAAGCRIRRCLPSPPTTTTTARPTSRSGARAPAPGGLSTARRAPSGPGSGDGPATSRCRADYDGDEQTDFAVWRPTPAPG